MSNTWQRVARFGILGLAGGLLASWLHQVLFLEQLSRELDAAERFGWLAILGGVLGAVIAALPVIGDRLGRDPVSQALRTGLMAALLGAFGGALALPGAEWLHAHLDGGLQGRMPACALWGAAIGSAVGLRSGARAWRGLAGGIVGGLVAGLVIEELLRDPESYGQTGILALLAIGLAISLSAALFVNVLSEAWLVGLEGSKHEGNVYHLAKYRAPAEAILGSAKSKDILVWIADAAPQHAAISLSRNGAQIRALSEGLPTFVEGTPIQQLELRDGQEIEVGGARFRYRQKG